ncbi:MAG: hypothetical protein HC887_09860 [Desulfobacteraceae bacterium]|nr:hypothetical protein [Desulfobacteraceae bacterium]
MDPDISEPNGLNMLGLADGARFRAEGYWLEAIKNYTVEPINKQRAYYYLGRIAHLLADMSVPAHVHNDSHAFSGLDGKDSYETYIEQNYYKWTAFHATILPDEIPSTWTFSDLFNQLAQRSQYFPSDDYDGNTNNLNANVSGWPNTTGWRSLLFSYIDESNLNTIGNYLMPLAIQYTTALYKLFWYEVNTEIESKNIIDVLQESTFKAIGKRINGYFVTSWEWDFDNNGVFENQDNL